MNFSAKVDWWALIIVILAVLGSGAPIVNMLRGSLAYAITGLVLAAVIISVVILPLINAKYLITEKELKIRFGLLNWNIPICEIRGAEESRDLTSGPAFSLDRVKIHYGVGSSILIAPKEKKAFLLALAERRCPIKEVH